MNISDKLDNIIAKWATRFAETQAPARTQEQTDLLKRQIAAARDTEPVKPMTLGDWLVSEIEPGTPDGLATVAADTASSFSLGNDRIQKATASTVERVAKKVLPSKMAATLGTAAGQLLEGASDSAVLIVPIAQGLRTAMRGDLDRAFPVLLSEVDQNFLGMPSAATASFGQTAAGDYDAAIETGINNLQKIGDSYLQWTDEPQALATIGYGVSEMAGYLGRMSAGDNSPAEFDDFQWWATPRPGVTDETAKKIEQRNEEKLEAIRGNVPFEYRDLVY